MALERVSFGKGREHKPRLSAPYVPGKRHDRYWSEAEVDVVRRNYIAKGAMFCLAMLPNRTRQGVYQTALKLGLRKNGAAAPKRKIEASPEMDARIREAWAAMTGVKKGEVSTLADQLNVPRWWLSKRALLLGLTIPRMAKEPPWSAAEMALLHKTPLHDPDKASEIFRANGFHRTPAALMVKAKRLGISRRYKEALSAQACSKILGVDAKTFTKWIDKGLISAGRRPTARLPQQGGDWHTITRAVLRQFIIDNVERIDFRKVDKFALVEILTAPAAGEHAP